MGCIVDLLVRERVIQECIRKLNFAMKSLLNFKAKDWTWDSIYPWRSHVTVIVLSVIILSVIISGKMIFIGNSIRALKTDFNVTLLAFE